VNNSIPTTEHVQGQALLQSCPGMLALMTKASSSHANPYNDAALAGLRDFDLASAVVKHNRTPINASNGQHHSHEERNCNSRCVSDQSLIIYASSSVDGGGYFPQHCLYRRCVSGHFVFLLTYIFARGHGCFVLGS